MYLYTSCLNSISNHNCESDIDLIEKLGLYLDLCPIIEQDIMNNVTIWFTTNNAQLFVIFFH